MKKKSLHSIIDTLSTTAEIDKTRISVVDSFGYYYLSCDGAVFASIHNNTLYLKGDDKYRDLFISLSMPPLVIKNKFMVKVLNYFKVTAALLSNVAQFSSLLRLVIQTALEQNALLIQQKKNRLKDLPNISLSLERLLWQVGIDNVAQLEKSGIFEAFYRLKSNTSIFSETILFKLHGALKHCHENSFSKEEKREILEKYRAYEESQKA